MNTRPSASHVNSVLIVGASRGLGLAMAGEFAARGWRVIATVRAPGTPLEQLAAERPENVEVETVDLTEADQIRSLGARLSGRMVTNVLGAMRAVEVLGTLARPGGVIGVMSSGQGSITNNTNGVNDVYRASKAALNQSMASYAGRRSNDPRALVLMSPGWIRTEMGGANAPFSVEEAVPEIVDVLIAQRGTSGLRYLDRGGRPVPW